MRSEAQEFLTQQLAIASATYDEEKEKARLLDKASTVTVRIIERRLKLKTDSLVNYRSNHFRK